MFARAAYRHLFQNSGLVNIGEIADILLYYSKVELILDSRVFTDLIRLIGADALIRLARLPFVKIYLITDDMALLSGQGKLVHKLITLSISDGQRVYKTKRAKVRALFSQALGDSSLARRQADFISQFVTEVSFKKGLDLSAKGDLSINDLFDKDFSREAARVIMKSIIPGVALPQNFRFDVIPYGESMIIDTDLDMASISKEYSDLLSSKGTSFDPSTILLKMAYNRSSFGLSASLGCDTFTTEEASSLFNMKLSKILSGRTHFKEHNNEFSEWVLSGKMIGKVIEKKEKKFEDFLDLVEESEKFKKWIVGIDQNESIAKEYFKEINSVEWIDRIPGKAMRYLAFTGTSTAIGFLASPIVGAASAAALSAADAFILDKIAKGWKPNHFVDGHLKKFLDG